MKLLHISDLHFRNRYEFGNRESSYQSLFRNMTPPLELLDRCMDLLGCDEKAQLDAVLISGDLTEDGTAADYAQLRSELERRFPGIPLVVTLGNHDEKDAFFEGWLGQPPIDGPFCYTVRIGDTSILALDNSDGEHRNGRIDAQRCAWLQKAAQEERGRNLILMMHHHLFPQQAIFPPCDVHPAFPEILKELPVTAILCGHTHRMYRDEYAGIPYRGTTSISFIGQDREYDVCMRENAGFSLYDIENGVIVAERHELLDQQKVLGYVRF